MKTRHIVFIGLAAAILIILAGASTAILRYTEVNVLIPLSISFLVAIAALPLSLRLWAPVSFRFKRFVAPVVNVIATAVVVMFILTGSNYYFADKAESAVVTGTVSSKHVSHRKTYRRLTRGRMVANGTQPVYNIWVKMPDKSTRHLEVTAGKYAKTRMGSKYKFTKMPGALGWNVYKDL